MALGLLSSLLLCLRNRHSSPNSKYCSGHASFLSDLLSWWCYSLLVPFFIQSFFRALHSLLWWYLQLINTLYSMNLICFFFKVLNNSTEYVSMTSRASRITYLFNPQCSKCGLITSSSALCHRHTSEDLPGNVTSQQRLIHDYITVPTCYFVVCVSFIPSLLLFPVNSFPGVYSFLKSKIGPPPPGILLARYGNSLIVLINSRSRSPSRS